jgi:hypothetical protein
MDICPVLALIPSFIYLFVCCCDRVFIFGINFAHSGYLCITGCTSALCRKISVRAAGLRSKAGSGSKKDLAHVCVAAIYDLAYISKNR